MIYRHQLSEASPFMQARLLRLPYISGGGGRLDSHHWAALARHPEQHMPLSIWCTESYLSGICMLPFGPPIRHADPSASPGQIWFAVHIAYAAAGSQHFLSRR
jgi:hypothetical protein